MKAYVLTLKSHPWLLPAVEDALRSLSVDDFEDVSKIVATFRASNGRPISDGDVLVALNALADLGIIRRQGSRYTFDKDKFAETEGLRSGIQGALQVLDQGRSNDQDASLCVSLPPALSAAAGHVIHESSMDLRSSLLDVVVSAKKSLIVASPFWDVGATAELVDLIRRKLAAGMRVSILGRFSHELPPVKFATILAARFCHGTRARAARLKRSILRPSALTTDNAAM
jgi:hypothetical protein